MILTLILFLQCVDLRIQYFYHLLVLTIFLLQHPQHVRILNFSGMLDERISLFQFVLQFQDYLLELMNFVLVITDNGGVFGNQLIDLSLVQFFSFFYRLLYPFGLF